jgi:GDP-L-fucose synthase
MIYKSSKIYVAGHRGMVGSATLRKLKKEGYHNLIFKTSEELDLRNQSSVDKYIAKEKPDLIIDAAARVGGILANNTYQFDFLMDNMLIQNNLINTAINNGVKKFIFFGSSCIYPRNAIQPINEDQLLTSPLEKTNQWYAVAKISGVKLIESIRNQFNYDYVSLMPTNLYGPNDNYDLKNSHVLPALIRKFHEAKLNNEDVILWGTGKPLREFLHVDDLADATMFFVQNKSESHLYNIGSGEELSISELAILIQKIVNHKGNILYDNNYPDGTPRKLLDSKRINDLGWRPKINLSEGIKNTYHDLLKKESLLRKE